MFKAASGGVYRRVKSAPSGVSVTPGTPTVVGTEITFPSTSVGSLVGALYGVEFGIGVSAGYVWSESVAGAASSQTITIDIATYGGITSSVVNARLYYNLDPLDDPSTRVYSAMLVPVVVSASLSGTTTEGQTLTGANGIIVGGYQMTLSQSWSACNTAGTSCTPITAGTATTYVLTSNEIGDTIKYTKTATNTAGSGSATSAASAVVTVAGPPGSPAHWYQKATGITQSGGTVSQWDDQIGTDHLAQATALKQPAYSAGTLTFNGSSDSGVSSLLKAVFTLNQPCTVGLRIRQVSWTNDRYITDGGTGINALLYQSGSSPNVALYAGNVSASVADFPVDAGFHSVIIVWNGASSVLSIDGVETTGLNAGTQALAGFALGGNAGGGNASNIAVQEGVIYTSAFDASARAALKTYLDGV